MKKFRRTPRSFAQSAVWGLSVGPATILDGLIQTVTLGQINTSFALNISFNLTLREARKHRDGSFL